MKFHFALSIYDLALMMLHQVVLPRSDNLGQRVPDKDHE
ncbi:MAG: hypothetical protein OFPII_28630 [Osedax symbiont Rs1]|nr:MAG: hypothetical protein OFPII_28630 [Osedax symbiont Rs1]